MNYRDYKGVKMLQLLTYVHEQVQKGKPFEEAMTSELFYKFHISAFKRELARKYCEAAERPTEADVANLKRAIRGRKSFFREKAIERERQLQIAQAVEPQTLNFGVNSDLKDIPTYELIGEVIRRASDFFNHINQQYGANSNNQAGA